MNRVPAIGLDFVARRRSSRLAGWLLLFVGVAVTGAAVLDWQAASEEAARWAAKAEHWQSMAKRAGHSGHEAVDGDAAALRPQVAAAAKAITRLSTPWGALYRSLEGSVDDSVSLLAISPNAEKGEVRLNGEAKDFAVLRGYLQRLSESGTLTDVRLLGQEVKQNDAQRPIVFSIVATWRQAS
jgi:Tfp pilus assembly protein PilN